jgi:hypothetical protein
MIPDYVSNEAAHLINLMVVVPSKERLGILDCLNHPWIKNEKFDENAIPKIINKQKIKKQKIILDRDEIELNTNKIKNVHINDKRKKLSINNLVIRSTSGGSRDNNYFSPKNSNFQVIRNSNTRFGTVCKGILLIS